MPQIYATSPNDLQAANGRDLPRQIAAGNATSNANTNTDAIVQRIGTTGALQPQVRSWAAFQAPASHAGDRTLRRSRQWLAAAAPGLTLGSLSMTQARRSGDYIDLAGLERAIGWGTLPLSFAVDAIKVPVGLAGAGLLGAVGGLQRLFGLAPGQRDARVLDVIFDSVLRRMPTTLSVVCAAGVDTPNGIRDALVTGGHGRFVALTLLHTAFMSRDLPEGTLLLVDGRSFPARACPRQGRALFDRTVDVQRFFRAHAPAALAGEAASRQFVAQWLPALWAGLQGNAPADAPESFTQLLRLCRDIESAAMALPVVQRRAGEFARVPVRHQLPAERTLFPEPRHFNTVPVAARAGRQATLSEEDVLRAFHRLLVQAVTNNPNVNREDYEALEPRAMLAAPSLALLEAAVSSDGGQVRGLLDDGRTVTLSANNCPPRLRPLFQQWQAVAARLSGLSHEEKNYLRYFLSLGDEDGAPARTWTIAPDRQGDLRRQAGDLCRMALVISRRNTFQSRLSADFEAVLQALPESVEATVTAILPEAQSNGEAANVTALSVAQEAGARAFGNAFVASARRNVARAEGQTLALLALSATDLMRVQGLVPERASNESLPADLQVLCEALQPVQDSVAALNLHQFRALENLLGAPTGDLRFVDPRVMELANVITEVFSSLEGAPSLEGPLRAVGALLG